MKTWLRTRLDKIVSNLEETVLVPHILSTGCCTVELENVAASTYDWSRLGVQPEVDDPMEADLLIVAGWINSERVEELRLAYSELRGRRSVIAVGACVLSGGPYLIAGQRPVLASDILPVDIFVPGCPPRPEALIDAIQSLKTRMKPGLNKTAVLYAALRDGTRS